MDKLLPNYESLAKAQIYIITRRYQEAERMLTTLVDNDKSVRDSMPLIYRATVYLKLNQIDKAFIDINKALENESNALLALIVRSMIYRQSGDVDNSFLDHKKAMEIDPKKAQHYFNIILKYFPNVVAKS